MCQKFWEDDHCIEYNLGLNITEEIDTLWELFLVNTYDHNELDTIDLTTVIMPHEWLLVWLDKLR